MYGKFIPYTVKHSRGKTFAVFVDFCLTANVFPCMFCKLVVLIHYSDEMMALTASL